LWAVRSDQLARAQSVLACVPAAHHSHGTWSEVWRDTGYREVVRKGQKQVDQEGTTESGDT
jgi:thiaminase